MRTVRTKVYKFDELSKEAQETAIEKWYEREDYPFFDGYMQEELINIFENDYPEIKTEDLKALYSIGYSQGDGACFTGRISGHKNTLKSTHNFNYYHKYSTDLEYFDKEGEYTDEVPKLKNIYFDVCNKLEKYGYSIIEYRMNTSEFSEHCEANNYEFTQDGKMY